MISIYFKSGEVRRYKPEEYTEYKYDGRFFIVIRNSQWIGMYNLDSLESIEVTVPQTDCGWR